MAKNKTQETENSVLDFLNSVENDKRRQDSFRLLELIEKVSGTTPKMWGDSLIGFGNYTYKYKSGREGEWFFFGFSPRKAALTVYFPGYVEDHQDLVHKVSTKHGKGCIYIKDLSKVNEQDMINLIQFSFDKGKEL